MAPIRTLVLSMTIFAINMNYMMVMSQCVWHHGEHTLNLTALQGVVLNTTDQLGVEYNMTICENSMSGCFNGNENSSAVVIGYDNWQNNTCYTVAQWTNDSKPTWVFEGRWYFEWINTVDTQFCPQNLWNIVWDQYYICQENVTAEAGQVSFEGECLYSVYIYTKYACD